MIRELVSLGLVILALHGETAAAESLRIRVLSYNIHHGEGTDGKIDLQRIANVIKSVSPDIVALQEVDRNVKRSGVVDQPAELARLTNMHVAFEPNIDLQGGHYGNAVLTKQPLTDHQNIHFDSIKNGEQRGVLICELQPKLVGQSIFVFCTHLDHRSNATERIKSSERINRLALDHQYNPSILMGDLNATMESKVLETLRRKWQVANRTELPTVPVEKPRKQIDFVLVRPADRWKTVDVRVLDESIASDHRAVFAELEVITDGK